MLEPYVFQASNPGAHTDTRSYYKSIVNPMLALERKAKASSRTRKIVRQAYFSPCDLGNLYYNIGANIINSGDV